MQKIRKNPAKKMLAAVLVWVCITAAAGCSMTENTDSGSSKGDGKVKIELTQRQQELLQEKGLPTEYDKLTDIQKNAIVSIEAMLVYLEDKYQEEFCYLSYTAAGLSDKEHLEAYPASGTPSETVNVYRTYKNREYQYSDDYGALKLKPLYENQVRSFAAQTFPENGLKVFCDMKAQGQSEKMPIPEEDKVMQTVSAVTYVFISENVCTKEQLDSFTEVCVQWMKNQCSGKAAQICLRLAEQETWDRITASNYKDRLMGETFTAEAECTVTASGRTAVY